MTMVGSRYTPFRITMRSPGCAWRTASAIVGGRPGRTSIVRCASTVPADARISAGSSRLARMRRLHGRGAAQLRPRKHAARSATQRARIGALPHGDDTPHGRVADTVEYEYGILDGQQRQAPRGGVGDVRGAVRLSLVVREILEQTVDRIECDRLSRVRDKQRAIATVGDGHP